MLFPRRSVRTAQEACTDIRVRKKTCRTKGTGSAVPQMVARLTALQVAEKFVLYQGTTLVVP
jgi:hypothetical protein